MLFIKNDLKRYISFIMIIILTLSTVDISVFAADPKDYYDIKFYDPNSPGEFIIKPTASFELRVNGRQEDNYSNDTQYYKGDFDSGDPDIFTVNAQIGDVLSFVDHSFVNSDYGPLSRYEFQYTRRNIDSGALEDEQVKMYYSKSDFEKLKVALSTSGRYDFYLCVMDSTPLSATGGWGNWSQNGNHRALGRNPSGFDGYWYYTHIRVTVDKDRPIPEFSIKYQGKNVTDNQASPATVDTSDKKLVLQDMSTPSSAADPIVSRIWYYWSARDGWTEIEGSANQTAVVINDFDADLPETALNKAFKLEVIAKSGADASKEHTAYFKYSTGSITTYYIGIDGSIEINLYPPAIETDLPLGTYTRSAKPAPTDYTLVSPTSQQVRLTTSNPKAYIYFYYHKLASSGGTIVVYYKDKLTDADIIPSDIYNYDYGTYEVAAQPAPQLYTLLPPETQSVTLDETHKYVEVKFYYQPDPSLYNKPPVAIIDAPDKIYAGENFRVSGKKSYDTDGRIDEYMWYYDNDITGNTIGNDDGGYIWMPYGSSGLIKLQVKDNQGATGNDRDYVEVLDPVPIAKIDYSGIPKVNRKLTVSALNSIDQDHYPIDHARDTWAITADTADLKYSGTLTGSTKDILFKASGDKPIVLTVHNNCIDAEHPEGFSDTDSVTLKIIPDALPKADFSAPSVVIRNPSDSNYAKIEATNTSSSPDGDIIGKAVLMYAYDSDNDGNFEEETWYYSKDGTNWLPVGMAYSNMVTSFNIYSISTSSPGKFTLKTNQVGKYRFEMRVMEDIPASQTISSFITESDYKRNDTFTSKPIAEKIVDVKNVAPSVSFQAKKSIPMDLVVVTDYLGDLYDNLVARINTFKAQLLPLGINPTVSYVTDRKTVGERTVYQYEWNRFMKFTVDGWASNVRGDFPYHREFTINLESLHFDEGEENLPDRSKYEYRVYYWKYEDEDKTGDPVWFLGVEYDIYYDGQYVRTRETEFQLGHGQSYNGLGTWFDNEEHWDGLQIVLDKTYATTFEKGARSVSGRRAFQGLDVDKVMNVNIPSNNRYMLVAANSFWNTIEVNKPLKNYIGSSNMSPYLVADNETLNKVFSITNLDDIRFINGAKAYEKDGKLYQYSGPMLNVLPYTTRSYPSPVQSVDIPMHNRTIRHYKKDGDHESKVTRDEHYTTTIFVDNGSVTVNTTTIPDVKGIYPIDNYYFIEKTDGSIYYFKRYLKYWKNTIASTYVHLETKLSNPVQLSGASGIKSLKTIDYLDIIDYSVRARYMSGDFVNVYLQDKNGKVFTAKSGEIYALAGIMSGEYYFYSCSYPTALTDMAMLNTDVLDLNPVKTRTSFHYYDIWGNYRELPKDDVTVQYALTSELAAVYKCDLDVNVLSAKELISLKNLWDGEKAEYTEHKIIVRHLMILQKI